MHFRNSERGEERKAGTWGGDSAGVCGWASRAPRSLFGGKHIGHWSWLAPGVKK